MSFPLPEGWIRNADEAGYTRYQGSVTFDARTGLLVSALGERIGLVSNNRDAVGPRTRKRWWAAINTGEGPDHVASGFRSHRMAMRWADLVLAKHTRLGAEGCPCGECAGYRAMAKTWESLLAKKGRGL